MKRIIPRPAIRSESRHDPRWELVERIASSQCFRSSTRLREFLLYVGDCLLRDAPEEATEQQIGIHVFGRSPGYNSSEDNIVRTYARLLRQKLTEYFGDEGANEATVLEIPKGHYLPSFRPRRGIEKPLPLRKITVLGERVPQEFETPLKRKLPSVWRLVTSAVVLACLVSLGWWLWSRETAKSSAINRFWGPFMTDNSSLVIYSNALFTGDSKNGLRYAPPQASQTQTVPQNFVDTYTGIGEVAGIYELTRLFDSHHASFTLKRSLLATWDEAKLRNLIFIGSVAENSSLRDVTSATDFTMMAGDGYAGIVNHHPKPGELALYSRREYPLVKDYSILALVPGVQQGRHMLIFSGLMTIGTEGAVEFACHRDTLEELLRAATNSKREIRPFEAVLETTIEGGVPLQTRLVAIHVH